MCVDCRSWIANAVVLGIVTTQDMLRVTSTKSNVTVSGFVVQVPTVTEDTDMFEAAKIMLKEKSTLLPVVESQENLVLMGVVTLIDVFKHIDISKVPDKQIGEIMTTKVVTASPDDPLTEVWGKMVDQDFTGIAGREGRQADGNDHQVRYPEKARPGSAKRARQGRRIRCRCMSRS